MNDKDKGLNESEKNEIIAEFFDDDPDVVDYACELLDEDPNADLSELELEGFQWVDLLSCHPEVGDRCEWEKLSGRNWSFLLEELPQFADRCNWAELTGAHWSRLLRKQPQFADRCDWSRLDDNDWSALLAEQPQFADKRENG